MNSLKLATPSAHHLVHVLQARARQVRDDHVQAVIDGGPPFRLLPPGVERVAHARATRLNREIHDGGGAAERRRARAGFEIVAGGGPAERHIQMRVRVDAAGNHVHSGRHRLPAACAPPGGNARPHFPDALAFDQHIGLPGLVRGHHRAVADQSVHAHPSAAAPVRCSQVCGGRSRIDAAPW